MNPALRLLLLGLVGVLAQSREPSQWDAEVTAAFDNSLCTCEGGEGSSCGTTNDVTVEQTSHFSVTATYATGVALKLAYLTDQDGTIIAYKSKDQLPGTPTEIEFTWAASEAPTVVVPHIVYEPTCADVYPSETTSTWLSKLANVLQNYDVGNQGAVQTTGTASPPPPSINVGTLDGTWFNTGGSFGATFPEMPGAYTGLNYAWVKNQDGTILVYEEMATPDPITLSDKAFPRGSVDLTACRLFTTQLLCQTTSVTSEYMDKIEGITQTSDVGTYSTSNSGFTDVFSGHYDAGSGMTSIGPNVSSTCGLGQKYVIYAKTVDTNTVLGFKFDQALVFQAPNEKKYKVYLTCDGESLTTGIMDLVALQGNSVFSIPLDEVQVGSLECVTTKDDTSTSHADDNTTWFDYDGRRCLCEKGSLFCEKRAAKDVFLLNEGESVGLALSVSVIVLLLLCGVMFLVLKWSAQSSEKMIKLKENSQSVSAPEDRL